MNVQDAGGRDQALAANLQAVARAPAARQDLAVLRRSLRGDAAGGFEALRVLHRVLPIATPERDEPAYQLVAGLFAAYHQGRAEEHAADGDLGWSFGRLGRAQGWTEDRAARRLGALLGSSRDALDERLFRAVRLLRSVGIGIDWTRLAHDVRAWEWTDRPVQHRLARSFLAVVPDIDMAAPELIPAASSEGDS